MTGRRSLTGSLPLPLLNTGVRGLGLVGRLVLSLYLLRYFALSDIGAFGLVVGVVGMAPAVLGWGLNYFFGREIVDQSLQQALPLLRRRLIMTARSVSGVLILLLGAAIAWRQPLPLSWGLLLPTVALALLECLSFDLQLSLIYLRRATLANSLLFIRSAAWVFPAAVAGMAWPACRSLPFLLACWLGAMVSSMVLVVCVLRREGISFWTSPVDEPGVSEAWLRPWRARGLMIWLNEIGIVGLLYFDRYVVSHFLGLDMAGAFSTCWQLANAVQLLIYSGYLQPALPALVSAWRSGDVTGWRSRIARQACTAVVAAILLSAVLWMATCWGLPRIGIHRLDAYGLLFALMLGGSVLRLLADQAQQALYSCHADHALAWINIAGIPVTLLVTGVCASRWGLMGAGWATLLTPAVMGAVRVSALALSSGPGAFRSRKLSEPSAELTSISG